MYFAITVGAQTPQVTASPYRSVRLADGTFQTPQMISELVPTPGQGIEKDPVVTPDGLVIYWSSGRPDPARLGGYDIYRASRRSTAEPFAIDPARGDGDQTTVNSVGYEEPGWISADDCVLYFDSDRNPDDPTGALVGYHIWVAQRAK
jgi:hypothetical protein